MKSSSPDNLLSALTASGMEALIIAIVGGLVVALFWACIRKLGPFSLRPILDRMYARHYINLLQKRERFVTLPSSTGPVTDELELTSIYVPLSLTPRKRGSVNTGGLLNVSPPEHDRHIADHVLRENTRVTLLGQPGGGKSTLIRYLAIQYARGWKKPMRSKMGLRFLPSSWDRAQGGSYGRGLEQRFPVLVRLRDLYDERKLSLTTNNLAELSIGEEGARQCPRDFFLRQLKSGRCVMLMDGLDEVHPDKQSRAAEEIHDLATNHEANLFVLTSRLEQPYRKVKTFREFQICGFNHQDIQTYARKWYQAKEQDSPRFFGSHAAVDLPADERAREFVAAMDDNDNTSKLAESPLLLSMLANVHRPGTNLPTRRATFYELCIPALLEEQHRVKRRRGEFDASEKEQILKPVALWMHRKRVFDVTQDVLSPQIGPLLTEVGRSTDASARRHVFE